jgi:hypothetical protein
MTRRDFLKSAVLAPLPLDRLAAGMRGKVKITDVKWERGGEPTWDEG